MWLNGIRRTLIRWWLIAACVGIAAVPVVAAAQLRSEIPFEVESLDSHPECDAEREMAVRVYWKDADIGAHISDLETITGEHSVRVRRGASLSNVSVGSYEGPLGKLAPYEGLKGKLNGFLTLCISPSRVRIAEAEWSILVETADATLASSHGMAANAISEFSYSLYADAGRFRFQFVNVAAELTERESGMKHPVHFSAQVHATTTPPEIQQ